MRDSLLTSTIRKTQGAHFTPPDLARVLANRLWAKCDISHNLSVLDPACGDGELLEAFWSCRPRKSGTLSLLGVEFSQETAEGATLRLEAQSVPASIIQGDFLSFMAHRCSEELFPCSENACPPELAAGSDVIIANPPYVRTQVLGATRAQELARDFALSGRVDLYHAFIIAMTRQLNPGGLLGVITSNRFLSTKGGLSLRSFLNREYDIIEIIDLGDTKLFEAAVLPAIIIARKKGKDKPSKPAKFLKVYECESRPCDDPSPVENVYELLENPRDGIFQTSSAAYRVSVGDLSIQSNSCEPWAMVTKSEAAWIRKIDSCATYRISDLAHVRVGVKTTADNVFIRSDWHQLPPDCRPESELLKPLLGSEAASQWRRLQPPENPKQILYTHEVVNGERRTVRLSEYPGAKKYLELHRTQLEKRSYVIEAGRAWYEIWVPQNPAAWKRPKIVFPDISQSPKFFLDTIGSIVDGNCYWISLRDHINDDALFTILAVANSKLLMAYHDLRFQNKLYAGRRRFLTQYVERYPIPDPLSGRGKALAQIARQLVLPGNEKLQSDLEKLVSEAF